MITKPRAMVLNVQARSTHLLPTSVGMNTVVLLLVTLRGPTKDTSKILAGEI
jgi:hypothetical protein